LGAAQVEHPVPEQFKTRFNPATRRFVTEVEINDLVILP
jgi:hypothetical protein